MQPLISVIKMSQVLHVSDWTLFSFFFSCQNNSINISCLWLLQHEDKISLIAGNVRVTLFRMIYDQILYNKQSNYRSY